MNSHAALAYPDEYSARDVRERIATLQAELAADPDSKIARIGGEPMFPGPHRTRAVVEAELADATAALPSAKRRDKQRTAERRERQRAEREELMQSARSELRAAAHVAAEQIKIREAASEALEAADAELRAALSQFQRALGSLGPLSLGKSLNEDHVELLASLGDEAVPIRRVLPDGHPALVNAPTAPDDAA